MPSLKKHLGLTAIIFISILCGYLISPTAGWLGGFMPFALGVMAGGISFAIATTLGMVDDR
ncbi:hypothetical protein KAR91_13875 [Candidatus Pacearchaeota archaeon]|nr:hypothetical protein [Candidatus Pacearchaeota archaeon]